MQKGWLLYIVFLYAILIIAAAPHAMAEPQPGDSCARYPADAVMRSGGPELGGVFHVMRCTAGNWQALSDTTPDAFAFTDQIDVALSTQITSNSITITGIDSAALVAVSGQGGPQIRVNGGAWVTSGTIENGQSLEVRLTSPATNSTTHSATIDVGGVSDQWDVTTGAPACTVIGDVCADGSIFAGDTNMYVTDANQSAAIQWATRAQTNSGARSNTDGAANQAWIVANRNLSQYPAFQLCETLDRHGHMDWYLPAVNELHHLYTNKDAIGGFTTSWYWSSAEMNASNSRRQRFSDGLHNPNNKTTFNGNGVRCVRRD